MLSERVSFVSEGIDDLLCLEIEFGYDINPKLEKLKREFSRIHHQYLAYHEVREVKRLEARFDLTISNIVDDSEDIVDVLSRDSSPTNALACEVDDVLKRIQELYRAICLEPSYNINTGYNTNFGGQQASGSVSVVIGPSKSPQIGHAVRRESYGHDQNCEIVGFQNERLTLRNYLLLHDQKRVVGIVGTGGSGKTTLARCLYLEVKDKFDHKAWVCISRSWNRRHVLCEILRQIKGATIKHGAIEHSSEQAIVENLHEILSSKTYLIALDDIWAVAAWNDISSALPASKGSKILVTTCVSDLPELIDPAALVLKPKMLNVNESYELFCKRTFIDENPATGLQDLGNEMVKKCEGLPLAITALAGVLRVKKTLDHWNRISQSLMRNIMNMEDSTTHGIVKEILALSYQDLSDYLKPCALYLSIFPEGYEIRAGMLLKMWIAECLIACDDSWSEENIMLVAEEYLETLVQRYIVQDVKRNYMGRVKSFRMHDLFREVNLEKARDMEFLIDSHRLALSLTDNTCPLQLFELRQKGHESARLANSRLRSLIFIQHIYQKCWAFKMQPLCEKFRLLRVLILLGVTTREYGMPEEIGKLIHLRYLGLWDTDIEALPESIGNLQHLSTLDFRSLCPGRRPPKNLCKLKHLRHLYLPAIYEEQMSDDWEVLNLKELQYLQTLWNVKGGDWMLSEMANLSPSLQKLCVVNIVSNDQLRAVFGCASILSNNLQTLKLDWSISSAELCFLYIKGLEKCKNLRKVILHGKIHDYPFLPLRLPKSLIKLVIQETELEKTDVMAILGKSLPHLKVLTLGRDAYLGTELVCCTDSFPQLEQLKFEELPNLTHWTIESGAMCNLKELSLIYCPKLDLCCKGWRFISQLQQVTACKMSAKFNTTLSETLRGIIPSSLQNKLGSPHLPGSADDICKRILGEQIAEFSPEVLKLARLSDDDFCICKLPVVKKRNNRMYDVHKFFSRNGWPLPSDLIHIESGAMCIKL